MGSLTVLWWSTVMKIPQKYAACFRVFCFLRYNVASKVLHPWLQGAGYTCEVVTSGEDALRRLQDSSSTTSVVIADTLLPGQLGGIALLDRIIALGKDLRVIMMSRDDAGSECVKHGSYDFIGKPLGKDVLLHKINMAIQHRNSDWQVESDRKAKAVMRKAIGELSERSLNTPVQLVVESISVLHGKPNLPPEVRAEVECLRNLIVQNSNLYRPLIEQTAPILDPVTRSFLATELLVTVRESEFASTLPLIDVDDPGLRDLTQWEFNVFERAQDGDVLLKLVKRMFIHLDLLVQFGIRDDVLDRFLRAVKDLYKPSNPYHNWLHAVDVTQATFCYLVHFECFSKLSRLEWLALLVAALCHDLAHPGVNNAHLISSRSELAVIYNDRSVLENFHASSLFQLLKRDDVNIFASLTKPQLKSVRKAITGCILATDMANHFDYLSKMSVKVKASTSRAEWSLSDGEERLLLMQCVIKMADISNVARPWEVSVEWARRISEEFFLQGLLQSFVFAVVCNSQNKHKAIVREAWDKKLPPFKTDISPAPPRTPQILSTSLRCLFSGISGHCTANLIVKSFPFF